MSGCWRGEWGRDCSLGRTLHRFIKRKKFDDELVESSLAKSSTRAKGASGVEPGRCSGSEPSSSEKKKVSSDLKVLREVGWGRCVQHQICDAPQPLPWQLARVLQSNLMRGVNCPSLNLRCLPPGGPSLPISPFLAAPPPCHCILYHILCGRHGAGIYSGSRQHVPSIAGCKNNPQVALLWPQTLLPAGVFSWYPSSPPTLHSGVGDATSKEKDYVEVR